MRMGPVCKDNEPGIVCSEQHCGQIPCCLCLSSRRNILHRNETWIVSESNFGPAKRMKKGMEWNSHIVSKRANSRHTGLTPLACTNVHATCTVIPKITENEYCL